MNCPVCGMEMEAGWFYAGKYPAYWSPHPDVDRAPAARFPEDVLVVKDSNYHDCPPAHICKRCRKVVIEY